MTAAKEILRLIPTIQSAQLAGENMKMMKKKKKKSGDFVGMGIKNIVGVSLIKEQANIIESF
jgi:hypothetical protein